MEESEVIEYLEELKENYFYPDRKYEFDDVNLALDVAVSLIKEIQQYRVIGTVEECREARKRQSTKKVKNRKLLRDFHNRPYSVRGDCPNCGREGLLSTNTDYCNVCGQKLDWSDTP